MQGNRRNAGFGTGSRGITGLPHLGRKCWDCSLVARYSSYELEGEILRSVVGPVGLGTGPRSQAVVVVPVGIVSLFVAMYPPDIGFHCSRKEKDVQCLTNSNRALKTGWSSLSSSRGDLRPSRHKTDRKASRLVWCCLQSSSQLMLSCSLLPVMIGNNMQGGQMGHR